MLKAFTRNYEDNSTEAGFQFTFYCDLCNDGYKTSFIESETYKKGSVLKQLNSGARILSSFLGGKLSNVAWSTGYGADILSERFNGMSPEWQKEHEKAFTMAQNEAQQHFHRCHGCRRWICDADYNEEEMMCTECAPLENVAAAKIRSARMVEEMKEKAEQTSIYEGDIKEKHTVVCPRCDKPCGEGKFCTNCGANLTMNICPNCGAEVAKDIRFCGECGSRV